MGKLSIGIDFDHTIVNGDTPLPGARDALIRLKDLGYHIIIHSCNDAMWIATVLRAHDIPYDLVWDSELNRGKPICAAYVDDRGVGFDGD